MRSVARSLVPSRRVEKGEIPVAPPAPSLPPLPTICKDFDITSDFKLHPPVRRKSPGPIEPIKIDSDEIRRRHMRSAKFNNDEPPPPLPKRTMAWLGGKMTSNRKEATKRFIERRGLDLTPEQREAALKSIDELSSASSTSEGEDEKN